MVCSTKIKGTHHLQDNVQVYNARIPVTVFGSKLYHPASFSSSSTRFFPFSEGFNWSRVPPKAIWRSHRLEGIAFFGFAQVAKLATRHELDSLNQSERIVFKKWAWVCWGGFLAPTSHRGGITHQSSPLLGEGLGTTEIGIFAAYRIMTVAKM